MKKILLFGTNAFSDLLLNTIRQDEPKMRECLAGFVIDDAYYKDDTFCDKPVYKYSEIENKFAKDNTEILLCVGYTNMNRAREKIFYRLQDDGWKIADYINPNAIVRTDDIGVGNIIFDGVNIGVKCKIGDSNIFYPCALLSHHSAVNNFNYFAPRASIAGGVKIGNNCFFGNNCCTKNGITIADGTLVGAGCYVNKSTDVNGVYVPQRMTKLERNSAEMSKSLFHTKTMLKNTFGGGVLNLYSIVILIVLALIKRIFYREVYHSTAMGGFLL